MGNISNKIVVVTGATSGLGQAAAIDFAKRGARVIVVGRDAQRAEETASAIRAAGGKVDVVLGDVATRAGAAKVGDGILALADSIDVLINNAGGQFGERKLTVDGVEQTFALNVLGAYLLEKKLHGALAKARGRVVNLATGFLNSFPVDVGDVAVRTRKYAGLNQYGQAKQAAVMMTVEQSRRATDGVTYVALHPGIIMGTRFGGGQPKWQQAIAGPIMRGIGMACTLDEAVAKFHHAAFGDVPSGSYLVKQQVTELPKQVKDELVRAKVWNLLETLADPKAATKAA